MGYNSIVLVKQVPDTRQVSGDVMTTEGTMNRNALPAIFNPEDLNALEMALQVKELHGGTVTVITMGPQQAVKVLRESLYRGADQVYLLTDRKFAGADTQATSYTLKCAVEKVGQFDLVFCGRQAIDGDTAQVGPQVGEKLDIPQITYSEQIIELKGDEIVVQRAFDLGTEIVKCKLPCLLTVISSANRPRPASARKSIQYKLAAIPSEYPKLLKKWPEFGDIEKLDQYLSERNLKIPVWGADDLELNTTRIGLSGSPTQVHKISYVVLDTTESKEIPATLSGIKSLIEELIQDYVIG